MSRPSGVKGGNSDHPKVPTSYMRLPFPNTQQQMEAFAEDEDYLQRGSSLQMLGKRSLFAMSTLSVSFFTFI